MFIKLKLFSPLTVNVITGVLIQGLTNGMAKEFQVYSEAVNVFDMYCLQTLEQNAPYLELQWYLKVAKRLFTIGKFYSLYKPVDFCIGTLKWSTVNFCIICLEMDE